jgi:AcrR family transcriptional regulator
VSEPAYTRLDVDERRRRLLEKGAELFARHSYDELSMAGLARAAGVSKALLYHYFPSKQAYFSAVLEEGAAELTSVVDVDSPPAEQLDAFLRWVERRGAAYAMFVRGAAPEVRDLMELIRAHTAERIFSGFESEPTPRQRTAVRGWLWFMDGAILDWLEHRDLEREALRDLLLSALEGALGEPLSPA